MVYHMSIPLGFKSLIIVHLERLNILVAVKLFCTHWKGMNILIHCEILQWSMFLGQAEPEIPNWLPVPAIFGCGRLLMIYNLFILMFQAKATEPLIYCLGGPIVLQM